MRKFLFPLCLFILTILAVYVSWRAKAPSWQGQNLRISRSVPSEFNLLFVGDVGTGSEGQKAVARAMDTLCSENAPEAVIFLGDNFYPKGVSDKNDPLWQSLFHDIYSLPCLQKIPFYAILGNHDYMGKPAAQFNYTSPSAPAWHMPYRHYHIDFGQRLRVIAVDSNILDFCGSSQHCTLDFLQESLQGSQAETIVLAHHPMRSLSVKYSGEPLNGRVLRRFLCGQDILFMAGHSHHLEHRKDPICEIDEVINGAGGASLYENRPLEQNVPFAKSTFGFVRVLFHSQESRVQFFDSSGDQLYEFKRPLQRRQ